MLILSTTEITENTERIYFLTFGRTTHCSNEQMTEEMTIDPKYQSTLDRLKELEHSLSQPDIMSDQKNYVNLTQEHSRLSDLKLLFEDVQSMGKQLQDNEELLKVEKDPEFIAVLQEDIEALKAAYAKSEHKLKLALFSPKPA